MIGSNSKVSLSLSLFPFHKYTHTHTLDMWVQVDLRHVRIAGFDKDISWNDNVKSFITSTNSDIAVTPFEDEQEVRRIFVMFCIIRVFIIPSALPTHFPCSLLFCRVLANTAFNCTAPTRTLDPPPLGSSSVGTRQSRVSGGLVTKTWKTLGLPQRCLHRVFHTFLWALSRKR